MSFLVAQETKSYEILGRVIAEAAPRLNVMALKSLDAAARLATPTVPLHDFAAELTVRFRLKPQAWPFGSNSSHGAT